MAKQRLTLERARQVFRYCDKTGCIYWRVGRGCLKVGREAGKPIVRGGKAYKRVVIDGYEYRVHRIVWLLVHGAFPTHEVDHIDDCAACRDDLKQRMQDEGYLERRPIEESYRGRYAKETRIEE